MGNLGTLANLGKIGETGGNIREGYIRLGKLRNIREIGEVREIWEIRENWGN